MSEADRYLELRKGSSERPSIWLRGGIPLEPLSLGRNAFWRIEAEGIADLHAFLYFDGEATFVASAEAANPALIGNTPVGVDWTELVAPCEIRLGNAVLLFHSAESNLATEIGAPPNLDDLDPDTFASSNTSSSFQQVRDSELSDLEVATRKIDDWELEVERRKLKPKIPVPDNDEPTQTAPTQATGSGGRRSRRKPKIKVPSAEEATRYRPLEEPATVPWPKSALAPTAPAPQAPTEPGPFSMQMPQGTTAEKAREPNDTEPTAPVIPEFRPPGVGSTPPFVAAPPAPVGVSPQAVGPALVVPAPQAASSTTTTVASSATTSGVSALTGKVSALWKQATLPQKAILCLLPVAFIAVFVAFSDDEPQARKKAPPKPSASALASPTASQPPSAAASLSASAPPAAETASSTAPSAVASALAKISGTSAPSDKGLRPTSGKGAPPRTLERQAADAVAGGSYAEALKAYEQLAQQHPENPAFAEAVRILRVKLTEPR